MRLHLDTDIGGDIDDLCALALAMRSDAKLTGVTTTLEHGGKRAGYARYALALEDGGDVPLAAGADVALGCFRAGDYALPIEERYWPETIAAAPGPVELALELLKHSIERGAIIVAIGPLTNLALLERRSPGVLRAATLVVMGGHVSPPPSGFPQWDHVRDFNLQTDVEAAARVFGAADPARTTLVPIDVTVQTALRRADLPALREAGQLGALIARQADAFASDERYEQRYGSACAGLPSDIINFQHDALTVAVALGWSGVAVERQPLSLVQDGGWVRFRPDADGPRRRVVRAVRGTEFGRYWLETVARPPTARA